MKKQFLFLMFFAFAVLLIANAHNVNAEFYVNTNLTTNAVCPASTILISTAVSSTTAGSFSVTQAGSANNFATTVPVGFYLEPYQTQVIYTYITPSTKISPGLYNMEIKVSDGTTVKTVKQEIVVENCHDTKIIAEPVTQTICSCEQKQIMLTVFNNGKYLENYNIRADGVASIWTNLSLTKFTLAPNSSQKLYAYINTPCNIIGNYELNFITKADSEYSQANTKASFNVVSCYDYSLTPEKFYYPICENEKITIPLTLTNKGVALNNYKINLDAPSWMSIDQKELSIAANGSKIVNLIVQPQFKTIGNYTAKIDVLSTQGRVIKKQEITIESKNCYGVTAKIQENKDRMCNALTKSYSVLIRNTGKFQNNYDLTLNAPAWAKLSEKTIKLNASGEKLITLEVHPPYDLIPGMNNLKITVIDQISNYSASDSLELSTISVEDCYKPQISSQKDELYVAKDSTLTEVFVIENKGISEANYTLELSGTATQFATLNPGTLTIKPAKAQTIYLYLSPSPTTPTGNYSLTVSARLKDTTIVSTRNVNIIVTNETGKPQLNLTNQTTVKSENIFTQFWNWLKSVFRPVETTTQPTSNIITNKTTTTNKTNVSIVTTNTTAIVSNKTNTTESTPKTNVSPVNDSINKTSTATTKENQTAPSLIKQIPDVNIQKNDKIILDMHNYFKDSTNSKLTFVVVKPNNLTIAINNSQVTIIPDKDYMGSVQLTLYASNGKEITASNKFVINVTDAPTTNLAIGKTTTEGNGKEFLDAYKFYILAAILVIIILAIILSGAGKKIVDFFTEEDEK